MSAGTIKLSHLSALAGFESPVSLLPRWCSATRVDVAVIEFSKFRELAAHGGARGVFSRMLTSLSPWSSPVPDCGSRFTASGGWAGLDTRHSRFLLSGVLPPLLEFGVVFTLTMTTVSPPSQPSILFLLFFLSLVSPCAAGITEGL